MSSMTADSPVIPDTPARLLNAISFDEISDPDVCPSAYQVLTMLACPPWCELPADHDAGGWGRAHRAEVWQLDDRAT